VLGQKLFRCVYGIPWRHLDLLSFKSTEAPRGDLLIGIAAEKGIAQSISGTSLARFDDGILGIKQLLTDNLEPRLPVICFRSIPYVEGFSQSNQVLNSIRRIANRPLRAYGKGGALRLRTASPTY